MARVWLIVVVAAAAACTATETPDTPGWAPVAGLSRIDLAGEPVPWAEVLGRSREQIEASLPAGVHGGDPSWVRYGENLLIEWEDDRALRLRVRTPQAFGCTEAARWMGFAWPRRPVIDGTRCLWPGARLHHRLAKGFGGEYDVDTRWFRIWLVDGIPEDGRPAPSPLARFGLTVRDG